MNFSDLLNEYLQNDMQVYTAAFYQIEIGDNGKPIFLSHN